MIYHLAVFKDKKYKKHFLISFQVYYHVKEINDLILVLPFLYEEILKRKCH